MNFFSKKILRFILRKAQLLGVAVEIKLFSINSLQKILFSGILCCQGDNVVRVANGSLKVSLGFLLRKRIKISVILNDVEIVSKHVSKEILKISKVKFTAVGAFNNRDLKISGNMPYDIGFNFEKIGGGDAREFFFKLTNISISKYKTLMQGHLLSDFISNIYDDAQLHMMCYYKHENKNTYPTFNTILVLSDKKLFGI